MLAIGKKWNHVYVYGHLDVVWENGQSTMTIVEDGKTLYSESIDDTVRINDVKYFVVKNLHTAAGVQPLVYMREDTIAQKVWVLPNKESEEQLLYSFNVAIGDTLRDITFYPAENRMLILSLAKYIVTNINLTDGRKTIQLHAIVPYGPELDPEAPPFEHDFTWIEGVGEKQYGLSATWYNDDRAGGISSSSLLCVQKDGEILYASAKGKEYGCELEYITTDALDNAYFEEITFANRNGQYVILVPTSENILSIELYDYHGRNLLPANYTKVTLPAGISPNVYMLIVKTTKRCYRTKTIIF